MTRRNGTPLLYLCYEFPVLTQTFTVNEVRDLLARGLPVRVFACRASRDPEALLVEGAAGVPVENVKARPGGSSLLAFVRWFARRPLRTLSLSGTVAAGAYRDQPLRCWARGFLQLLWGARLAQRLREAGERPHLHAQFVDAASTVAFVAARLLDTTFSVTNHTAYNPYLLVPKLRRASFVVSISEFDRRLLGRMGRGAGRDRIRVVRQGVDVDALPFTSRPRPRTGPFRVLSVAGLREKKGHHVLLDAVSVLVSRGRDVRLTIVGEGPERERLERRIADLGLEARVSLPGAEAPGRIRERLGDADGFALACIRGRNGDLDGIPVSLMEAMAAGVPVVSTRISGIPELVEGGSEGLLCPPGDAGALADALTRLMDEDGLGERLARTGREKVAREYDRRRTAERMAGLFAEVGVRGGRE